MKKIQFNVKQIYKNIFAVIVPDKYDRAMLFCRVQEFYENPNSKIRNKSFSIWDFYKTYSLKNSCFTYTKDWSGYNLPVKIAKKCYEINEIETPYDEIMIDILRNMSNNSYLMGIYKQFGGVFNHELCHGFYYTNINYKKEMNTITKSILKKDYNKIKKNLLSKGYSKVVIDDEIQAYMATESNSFIVNGVKNKISLHKKYKKIFDKFKLNS